MKCVWASAWTFSRPLLLAVSLLSWGVLLAGCASESEEQVRAVGEAVLNDVAILASDEYAGRDPQSEAFQKSIAFVAERFARLGLETPTGSDGYCQTVKLRRTALNLQDSFLTIGEKRFSALDRNLVITAPPSDASDTLSGEAFFAGYGIDAPEYGLDPYGQHDVTGKVVVYLNGSPANLPSLPAAYLASQKTKAALARGAVATIEIETTQSLKRRPWSLIWGHFSKPFGLWLDAHGQVSEHLVQGRATVRTHGPVTDALFAGSFEDFEKSISDLERVSSFPMGVLVQIERKGEVTEFESCNVIGILPGSDSSLSKEAVVYMAHLDHLGEGLPVNEDRIYNGAVDNAIGVGIVLRVAEALSLSGQRPDRTLIFAALTAEEDGLLGSDYLAHNPVGTDALGTLNVVAAANIDMPILTFPFSDLVFLGEDQSNLGPVALNVAKAHGMPVSPDPSPAEASYVRSDHYSFVKVGIPAVQTRVGPGVGGERFESEYRSKHYHQTSDETALLADVDTIGRFTNIQADLVRGLANMDENPAWHADSIFAGISRRNDPPRFAGPFSGTGKLPRPIGPHVIASAEEVLVNTRDGITLATDVYLPSAALPTETILIRTPYNKAAFEPAVSQTGTVATFVEHGYAVLVQDTRGKFGSGGQFAPLYRDDVDAYDTMDWIVEQPWSNGVIGTFGCSYLGETQMAAMHLRHPAWKAAIPMASAGANNGLGGRHKPFALWNGGAVELAMGLAWFHKYGRTNGTDAISDVESDAAIDLGDRISDLPVQDLLLGTPADQSEYRAFLGNTPVDGYWSRFPYLSGDETADIPTLFISSWYDYGTQDTFAQFEHFRRHAPVHGESHRVVVDPGLHCEQHTLSDNTIVGSRALGDARYDFFKLYLSWFDHWLRGLPTGANELARVTYYRMGDGKWLTAEEWPPRHTDIRPYYFSRPPEAGKGDSGQLLETAAVNTDSASFVYDPGNPLPTLAAPVCCTNPQGEISLEGAHDQSANATRSDVLIFETDPLAKALNVTGPISVNLFVSSDARDTDFTVKLIDVYPDGRAFNVVDGIQRMRWRNGFDVPDVMQPDEIYAISIDLQATSNVFLPGHKLRIEVSSSNFPRFTRNLNTGELNHTGSTFVSATNTVHMGGDHASHVLLPVGEL